MTDKRSAPALKSPSSVAKHIARALSKSAVFYTLGVLTTIMDHFADFDEARAFCFATE